MYFLAAKSTKNSPADAFACFVPSNVRNGRLFAGAHAPRPRFLSLLAGPSFDGSGIEPGSFAACGGVKLSALSLAAEKERREGGALKNGAGLLATTSSRREQSLLCRAATVEAAHSFAPQTHEGARFSVAERRSRESDMRMVLVLPFDVKSPNPI
jgi:hypothetical protein